MKIAIEANPKRGKEIISLLESLGGRDTLLKGNGKSYTYYIDENNMIRYGDAPKNYKVYTLEEFEKEFPFKIGDEVIFPVKAGWLSGKVTGLTYVEDQLKYEVDTRIAGYRYIEPHKLSLYPMKEERHITLTLDKAKEWYKKGGELREIALQAFTEKELTKVDLPKTWEEFYEQYEFKKTLNTCLDAIDISLSLKYVRKFKAFVKLQYLRDCWRQGWEPTTHEAIYAIKFSVHGLGVYNFVSREFLSFPTKEMAKEFLECFKDLIEKAGDLI